MRAVVLTALVAVSPWACALGGPRDPSGEVLAGGGDIDAHRELPRRLARGGLDLRRPGGEVDVDIDPPELPPDADEPAPGDEAPGDPDEGDPDADAPAGDPDAGDPTSGDTVPGDPVQGDPIPGDPVPADPDPPRDTPLRICPMGDSITAGNGEHATYRRPLWHMLLELGVQVDFVGSMHDNNTGPPPYDDYDWDNEAHGGYRADQLADRLPEWIASYTPEIVLLHIGTNDLLYGDGPADVRQDMARLIQIIRQKNPRAVIFLAQIIGMTTPSFNEKVDALNATLPAFAQSQATSDSPVIVVDQRTPFDPGTMTFDGTHPNDLGEQTMADAWLEALVPWL